MTSLIPLPTSYLSVTPLSCVVLNAGCSKKVGKEIAIHAAGIVVGETLNETLNGLTAGKDKKPADNDPPPPKPDVEARIRPSQSDQHLDFVDSMNQWGNQWCAPFDVTDGDVDAFVRLQATHARTEAMILTDADFELSKTLPTLASPLCMREGLNGDSSHARLKPGRYYLVVRWLKMQDPAIVVMPPSNPFSVSVYSHSAKQ